MIPTGHYVTERGAANLTIDGKPALLGQPVDAADWPTLPSLVRQGFLLFIPEEVDKPLQASFGEPLWDGFPHKSDLEAADLRTVQQVYWLTDEQLEALPGIGEVGVGRIRAALLMHRGKQPQKGLKLSESEVELVLISRGEQKVEYAPPTEGRNEGITVGGALKAVVEALDAVGFLELHLTTDELTLLRLSRPDFDPAEILAAMRAEDGMYKLSEPLGVLLERLGLTYPPEPAPTPAELTTPAEMPAEHPTNDPEPAPKDAESTDEPEVAPAKPTKKRSPAKN